MNIVHIDTTIKRKSRFLPLTNNYLEPDISGSGWRWAEPNHEWRTISAKGQQKHLITNLQFDSTDHSDDLWLYTILKPGDDEAELKKNNILQLDKGRPWYVRQFTNIPNKVGIQRFTGLPLNAFMCMWRRTIPMPDIQLYGLANGNVKVIYAGLNFNVFLRWEELQMDYVKSVTVIKQQGANWTLSERVAPWLHENCRHGIIPFSDYDTVFPDTTDEVAFNIDLGGIS